jgi:uncharacterized protein YidB (DUF937 family)
MGLAKSPSGDRTTEITAVVNGLIEQQGGVSGVLRHLERLGLGKTAETWVRKGPNLPISGDHVQALVGSDVLLSLAAELRLQPQEVASMIAQALPQAVDQLTPDGVVVTPCAKP